MLQSSQCDKTKKIELKHNSKNQNVTKHQISNCDKLEDSNCNYTRKLKWLNSSNTKIVTKLKPLVLINLKTQILKEKNYVLKKTYFLLNVFWLEQLDTSTTDEIFWCSLWQSSNVFLCL